VHTDSIFVHGPKGQHGFRVALVDTFGVPVLGIVYLLSDTMSTEQAMGLEAEFLCLCQLDPAVKVIIFRILLLTDLLFCLSSKSLLMVRRRLPGQRVNSSSFCVNFILGIPLEAVAIDLLVGLAEV